MATTPLLLVGGGKMGGALVTGWLDRGVEPGAITVIDPDARTREAHRRRGVNAVAGLDEVPAGFAPAVVVLAVKPQAMDEVLPPYTRFTGPDTVFLSIAAGRTIASLTRHLGNDAAVVRAMPNTPAAVGRGVTVMCANATVTEAHRTACDELLRAAGETGWVEDEDQIDAVTAVAGSGPAYVFHLIECLAAAGVEQGLPDELARRIARATVAGAGELARQRPEPAEELRANVTSPGGTTQAALDVLMAADGLRPLIGRTVAAAVRRSRELAG